MRNFYHNFPRIIGRSNYEQGQILKDGIEILKLIREIGLILTPECVEWKQTLIDGNLRSTIVRQNRISFTELPPDQIQEHGEKFGPFSIEFKTETLRRLGALPVIYMPQPFSDNSNFSGAASTIVAETSDIKYILSQLHQLSQFTDPDYLKSQYPNAESISPDCLFNLQNTDEHNNVVQSFQIPFKYIKDFLSYIGFKNAPFELMIGVLNGMQSLFYPTDDSKHDLQLEYYRQREWRIIGGAVLEGKPQTRLLDHNEKRKLLDINSFFWDRELNDGKLSLRRVDEAVVLDTYQGQHITEAISWIRVPDEVYDEAKKIFGDKVLRYDA